MKYNIVVVFILLFFSTVKAQNCSLTLSGIVEDFHEKTPIENATVFIKNANKYAVTDTQGKFRITNICSGKITIEVAHLACETQVLTFHIRKNTYKVINLEHHEEELEEVNIKGSNNTKVKTAQVTSIKTKTIEKYSSLSLGDALKEVSGVSSLNTGSTIVKPIINGLHSSRVLINVNGVRLQDQEWGIEHAPNIDINSVGSISVIKGANALEFGGDAIGGVIVANPERVIVKDTLYGKTMITQQTNGLGISVSSELHKSFVNGWFVSGNASLKRFGDAKAPDYYLTNTGLHSKAFAVNGGYKKFEQGFNVYYSYITNKLGILKASHIGNVADLVGAINSGNPLVIDDFSFTINNPKQKITHQIAKGLFYKRFKGLGKLDMQYDYQNNHRFEYDIRRSSSDNSRAAVDLLLKTHSAATNFKFDANSERVYKVGISARYQNNFANPSTGVRRLIPDYDKCDAGVYALVNLTFNDYLVNVAARYDVSYYNAKKYYYKSRWNDLGYNTDFSDIILSEVGVQYLTNPTFTYHNVSASAGVTYQFNENNSILINYGLANRAPNPSELFSDGLHHSAARIELGDLRITSEFSHRIGTTYTFSNEAFKTVLEGFFNKINNFIYIEPTGVEYTIRGAFPVYTYKQTDAVMWGLDATLRYIINKNWQFENKSAYIYGSDAVKNRPLIDIPPFKTENSIQYTNKKWYNFSSKLTSEFVGKQNRYPNNNFNAYISTTNSYVLVDISSTPKAYHLLNFSSDVQFNVSKAKLEVGFLVNNILNTSYRNYLNRLRYFANDLGRNFIIKLKINY